MVYLKVVFKNWGFPISMNRQKVSMEWRKCTVAVQKCMVVVDHARSRF
jgi:hypothetical protein